MIFFFFFFFFLPYELRGKKMKEKEMATRQEGGEIYVTGLHGRREMDKGCQNSSPMLGACCLSYAEVWVSGTSRFP